MEFAQDYEKNKELMTPETKQRKETDLMERQQNYEKKAYHDVKGCISNSTASNCVDPDVNFVYDDQMKRCFETEEDRMIGCNDDTSLYFNENNGTCEKSTKLSYIIGNLN